ncbi:MAG: hypothetical protein JJT89_09015 [Nitriliruptoraceae bacterium]|nr:hypothetical protein [Nitriliruptoraceae bacterium]
MSDARELATVELLGALAYGQLRSYAATARLIELASDVRRADAIATVAAAEYDAYRLLAGHLAGLTQLPLAVMERQKPAFDQYFDRAPLDDRLGAAVFFALGLPIAADFARAVAPRLDESTAAVVLEALATREDFEQGAIEALREQLVDAASNERARHLNADLLGRALTTYQHVVSDSDALRVLFASGPEETESAERRVKRLAIEVLGEHRRRTVALGLEDLEDVT